MASSPRRALHYGDIIYLSTSGGSVGTFYSFTNLNNVLLLEKGSGVQTAQAMWCSFRIVPPYACNDQDKLVVENSRAHKDWVTINQLEKSVALEKLDNKKRFVRSLTRAVRYHQQIQLQHVSSGKFLSHTPFKTSSTEDRNFPCCLEEIPSEKTKFKVHAAIPGYISGDVIHDGDVINLFTDPDGFIRYSETPLNPDNSFFPAVPEINIGPARWGFTASVVQKIIEQPELHAVSWEEVDLEELLNPLHLLGTNIIQLLKCETDMYYVYDGSGKETTLALKNFPKKVGRHYCTSIETYWIVEHDEDGGNLNGSVVKESSHLRLKNFISGEYVKLPGNNNFVRFESALVREEDYDLRTGTHVKLATENGYIGHENDKVVVKANFDYSDTLTLREVESDGRVAAIKLQGLSILLNKLLATDSNENSFELTVKHHDVLTTVLEESGHLLDTNSSFVDNYIELGIVKYLAELAKRYNHANNKSFEVILCMDAICKIFNKVTSTGKLLEYSTKFIGLVTDLIAGSLMFAVKNGGEDLEDDDNNDEGDLIISPLHSFLYHNAALLTRIPKTIFDELLDRLLETVDLTEKREIIRILCRLCRCKQKTIPSNQATLIEFFFKNKIRSTTLLEHVVKNNDVFYNGTSITTIDQTSELYLDLVNQLELYECILFGRHMSNGVEYLQHNNMFALSECVYVIKKKGIDRLIKSWYIQIMIAAHIDTGFTETAIIPNMLTFQYEQNVTNRAQTADAADKPPDATDSLYQKLLSEIEMFLRKNATCTVKDPESVQNNVYNYNMVRLLEYMFRAGRINHENANRFISPLIGFLDGTCDNYSNTDSNTENEQTFQKIFRFKSSKLNKPIFMIKKRALRALYYAYEKALFYYWTDIMKIIYTTIKSYDTNKDTWLSQIGDFIGQFDFKTSLHEIIIRTAEDKDFDILSPKESDSRESLFQLLEDEKRSIELFAHTQRLVTVLMDTMRYEDPGLSERSLKLLVMIRSPTNRLLELLPKSEITLSDDEFYKRKEIATCVTRFLKVSKNELSLQSRLKICETVDLLEQALHDKETGVNKVRQKLLFDLDTVSEVITLLCQPTLDLIIMPTDKNEQEEAAKSVDMLKAKGFSLLRLLITGLPDAQSIAMKHFKELISVKGESNATGELELARVVALNEVFTANTNLCIKVSDDILQAIFEKLLSLVNVSSIDQLSLNSDSTYRYFELLENILDLEESDQVLYKLQASILRFMRDYWVGLNGTVINNGKEMTLNLLECRKEHDAEKDDILQTDRRDWKGLYFVRSLSLMSCCALGSVKSSLTICKELIPYAELKSLLLSSSWDVIYFNCLSKFFLNVYVKTRGIVRKNTLITDALEYIRVGIWFGETLFGMLLEGDADTKLDRLKSIAFFNVTLKLISSNDEQFTLFQILDCVFYDLLPLVAEVYGDTSTSLLDACGGMAQTQQLSTLLRNLLRVTSNFLTDENFTMLLSTIQAVNSYRSFQSGTDLEVARNGVLWKIDSKGISVKEEGKVVTTDIEILIKDVLDLRRERAVQRAILEMQECSRINKMFQTVILILRKIIKSDMTNLFFTKSLELHVLGNNILGTSDLEGKGGLTLSDVVYAAPAAKNIVLATVSNVHNSISLTYKEEELWMLLKRVFGWLKEHQLSDRFIVKQLINSITLQIETLKLREDTDVVVEIITKLLEADCVEMLCKLINISTLAQPAITCLSSLLQFPAVQRQMLKVCRSNEDPVFEWVWEQIETAGAGYEQFNMAYSYSHSSAQGGSAQPIVDIDTATPQMRLSIQFLGRLSNKKAKLQDYLRSQDNKVVTHNFLAALLNLLKTIPTYDMIHGSNNDMINGSNNVGDKVEEHSLMIADVLVTLVDMLSTNTKAKEYSMEMGIIESVDRLLLESRNSDTKLEDQLKIRINCYDVLITLLEHDQNLLDVGEKIFDALNMHEMHESVSEHLQILNSSADEGVRKLSFTAVFKGYNIIKKMYGLDADHHLNLSIDDVIRDADVKVESVEVVWNDALEKVYFPSTEYSFIRRKVKDEMLWGLTRKTLTDKNVDFLRWSKEILVDMNNVEWLKDVPIVNRMVNIEFLWDWCVFLLALIIQVWLLFDLEDYGMSDSTVECGTGDYAYLEKVHWTSYGGNSSQEVCVSHLYHRINIYLGLLQLLSTLLLTITYVVTNYHRFTLPTLNWSWIYGKSSEKAHSKPPDTSIRRMAISLTSFYHLWLFIMITCSVLGIWLYGIVFCVHLLHIICMFDLLTRVIKGATANRDQLLIVIPFSLCIILIYAIAHFHLERKGHDNSNMEYCDSLLQCFVTAVRYSFRNSNGGHSYKWKNMKTEEDQLIRIAMDVCFWLMYSIIGLKVVTALILDGFISQKKERETALKDMQSVCTVCGIKKDQFASQGIDWYRHIKYEHNMWSYINLFYYLNKNNKLSKLSALESEVLEKFSHQDISFLPRETSLTWKHALKEADKRQKKVIKLF